MEVEGKDCGSLLCVFFFFFFFSGEVMVGDERGGQWMAEEKVGGGIFLKW